MVGESAGSTAFGRGRAAALAGRRSEEAGTDAMGTARVHWTATDGRMMARREEAVRRRRRWAMLVRQAGLLRAGGL